MGLIYTQLERIDEARAKEILAASGYRTSRKRMLCSFNMKEFISIMESVLRFDENGKSDEQELIDGFILAFEDEYPDVSNSVPFFL